MQILTGIRAGLSRLDFPSKRLNVAEIGAMVAERLSMLQKFLKKICSLICINSLHPSTLKIHLALQQFLEVTDRMENILFLESKPTFLTGKYMVQVFVHSILQMSAMDKVLSAFIDTFFANSQLDDNKIWNQKEGRTLLNSMKDFTDNLETVLFEAIVEDCYDVFKKFSADSVGSCTKIIKNKTKKYDTNFNIQPHAVEDDVSRISDFNNCKDDTNFTSNGDIRSGSITGNHHKSTSTCLSNLAIPDHATQFPTPVKYKNHDSAEIFLDVKSIGKTCFKDEVNSYPIGQGIEEDDSSRITDFIHEMDLSHVEVRKEGRGKNYQQLRHQCEEDEMRIHIRSAIRRQVEIEIFIPCSARLRAVLDRAFSGDEAALRKNVAQIAQKPQSFFGIPLQQTSPTNWDAVVFQMREVRSKSLPHDRLEALLLTAKEIPLLFLKEHPINPKDKSNSVTLGADDFLPIFIYVLARAQVPNLFALTEELQAMCDPDKRMSETGYYLATLEASLQHVIEAEVTKDSRVLFPEILRSKIGSDSDSDSDSRSDSDTECGSDEYTEHEKEESN